MREKYVGLLFYYNKMGNRTRKKLVPTLILHEIIIEIPRPIEHNGKNKNKEKRRRCGYFSGILKKVVSPGPLEPF